MDRATDKSVQQKPAKVDHDVTVTVLPPGPNSQALLKRLGNAIGRSNYLGLYGIALNQGSGPYMMDLDGNVYLDCLAGASVNILGYGNEGIPKRLYEIACSMQNTCFPYSPNVPAVELAEQLIRITPGTHPKRVMLGLSGSDSVGGALESVRKYTKKMGIIYFKNAYHGSTGLSQSASGFETLKEGLYPPSSNFISVDFPSTADLVEQTLSKIEEHLAGGKVGGVVAEIIQGDAGICVPVEGFFQSLMALLKRYNALLIADEIQSGMGRTGKWWACEYEGIVPDILVMGKGLAGGYAPISALVGREEVIDALKPAQHVFTFTGHSECSLAASLVITEIEQRQLIEHAAKIGELLKMKLKQLQAQYPTIITEVRGRGLMLGMEINIASNELAAVTFATRCAEKGVYFGYFGSKRQVVRIEPPYIIGEKEVAIIIRVAGEVAQEMYTGCIPAQTVENVHKYAIGLGNSF